MRGARGTRQLISDEKGLSKNPGDKDHERRLPVSVCSGWALGLDDPRSAGPIWCSLTSQPQNPLKSVVLSPSIDLVLLFPALKSSFR